ncbi:DUF4097 family beta strand repeat-containing protein [Hyalangium gracile]|uniref:DUF4097 family beta strand repeat-containing protein n=1 Tax=Hyalangium gracile TaxID=394092 RepID=UPI001CC9B3DA|nr:DUF4097 family beta strand repeat-containing protein [Hyalangium gracile]
MQRSLSWWGVLALACAGCAHVEARERFEQSFEQTVEGPISRVEVDTSSGDVRIRGVPGARLTVTGQISARAGSTEKARAIAEQIVRAPPVERSGDVLYVGRHLEVDSGLLQWVSIDYEVVVPPEVAASIDSASGDVEVQGVQGAVKVDSSSGDVRLTQVGSARINSSSGDVVLEEVAGDLEVDSSSGDVTVRATPRRQARWDLDASSGDISLAVEADAAFHLDASTSSGGVKSELPIRIQGTFEDDELHGQVGEGASEATVKASTSSGDITLRQQGPARPGAAR